MLTAGKKAPDFAAPDDSGQIVRLSHFRGRPVVLYFYPKDATPGCTTEACDFRDSMARLERRGATVLGVSPDSVASHKKFKEKHGLPFRLISDADHQIAEAYGVWVKKSMYGRTYWGNARTTFLIGPDGKIVRVWEKVKPAGHAAEVLAALAEMSPA